MLKININIRRVKKNRPVDNISSASIRVKVQTFTEVSIPY